LARLGRQSQARLCATAQLQRGSKGDLLSRSANAPLTGLSRWACNAQNALCPQPWGQRVGGVSGRLAAGTSHCHNGGRHPDLRDADSLRGLSEERGSWSVRFGDLGLVPRLPLAPATTGALWKNEEGNVVSVRQAHALVAVDAQQAPPRSGDTSFARSRDPCTSIGTQLVSSQDGARCRGGRDIAVGQTWVTRRNRHRGHDHTDEARLAARHRSSKPGRKLQDTRRGRA